MTPLSLALGFALIAVVADTVRLRLERRGHRCPRVDPAARRRRPEYEVSHEPWRAGFRWRARSAGRDFLAETPQDALEGLLWDHSGPGNELTAAVDNSETPPGGRST